MLSRWLPLRARSRAFEAVVIVGDDTVGGAEGVIERVRRIGPQVDVRMLLSDGGRGITQVDVQDWDWLELRVGDIVRVARPRTLTA